MRSTWSLLLAGIALGSLCVTSACHPPASPTQGFKAHTARDVVGETVVWGGRSLRIVRPTLVQPPDGHHSAIEVQRIPNVVVSGKAICGLGPIEVWEGPSRILSQRPAGWWILTENKMRRGLCLLTVFDNRHVDGPIEIHLQQEPQAGEPDARWWMFVWISPPDSATGLVLRPVDGKGAPRFTVETLRDGRMVEVGQIKIRPDHEAIEYTSNTTNERK